MKKRQLTPFGFVLIMICFVIILSGCNKNQITSVFSEKGNTSHDMPEKVLPIEEAATAVATEAEAEINHTNPKLQEVYFSESDPSALGTTQQMYDDKVNIYLSFGDLPTERGLSLTMIYYVNDTKIYASTIDVFTSEEQYFVGIPKSLCGDANELRIEYVIHENTHNHGHGWFNCYDIKGEYIVYNIIQYNAKTDDYYCGVPVNDSTNSLSPFQ